MNEEPKRPTIEPELEARIVALVLGEASDFEAEELKRLIAEQPELAAFKLHMQSVHGLLQEVGTGEFEAPSDGANGDWKLPADKRNAVLAVIRGEATVPAMTQGVHQPAQQRMAAKRSVRWRLTRVAAGVCVAGFVGVLTLPSFFTDELGQGDLMRRLGLATNEVPAVAALDQSTVPNASWGATNLGYDIDDAVTPHWALQYSPQAATTDPNSSPAESRRFGSYRLQETDDALSALRSTLGGEAASGSDFDDDVVSYFGEAEMKRNGERLSRLRGESEKKGRATATEEDASAAPPLAAGGLVFFDQDEGNWRFRERGEGGGDNDGDGTDFSSITGAVAGLEFQDSVDAITGDELINAAVGLPSLVGGPDGSKKVEELGRLSETLSLQVTPRIMIDEEESLADAGLSVAGDDQYFRFSKSAQPDSEVSEAFGLEMRDQRSKALASKRGIVSQQSSEQQRGGVRRELQVGNGFVSGLEKQQMETAVDASGLVERRFGNETQWMSEIDLAQTTAPGSEDAGKRLGNLFGTNSSSRQNSSGGEEAGVIPNLQRDSLPASGRLFKSEDLGVATPSAAGTSNVGGLGGGIGGFQGWADSANETPAAGRGIAADGAVDADEVVSRFDSWFGSVPGEAGAAGELSRIAMPESVAPPVAVTTLDFAAPAVTNRTDVTSGKRVTKEETLEKLAEQIGETNGRFNSKATITGTTTRSVIPLFMVPAQPPHSFELGDKADPKSIARGRSRISGSGVQENVFADVDSFQPEQQVELKSKTRGLGVVEGKSLDLFFKYHAPVDHYFGDTEESQSAVEGFKSMKRPSIKGIAPSAEFNKQQAAVEAFSTFSLHVSDVSFKLALAALGKGEWPEAAKVRIEEFVNAFDYGDPMPGHGEKVACAIEQSVHPFVQQRNLLRVSMRTAAAGRASSTPLRLTFLLDNSGSMERIDRQQTVRRAFALLAQQLTPIDQVTLISFARQPRLLADKVSGTEASKLVQLIDELPREGGTNIEAALQLAFEKASEQQTPDAQNRIILLTDGAVNLGNAKPESLSHMVTTIRNTGIAFDAAGISAEGLNDEVLEALTRQGDGRYYLLDSVESADESFARQIAGALRPSAKNVKVQVEFNPKRVGRYKLLGFERHILKKEDFRNDKVDAAEMAAAEAGVAMYQFEAMPDGEGDVGSVSVRFQDLSTGEMVENRWPIPYAADAPRPDQAAPSLRIATAAALLAAKLKGDALGESVDLKVLSGLVSSLPEQQRNTRRVQQLQQMIEQARQLMGKS